RGTPVVAGCNSSPILQPSEHDLDAVTPFVAALAVLDRLVARLPARDAGLYSPVFQRFSEPVGVIAAISEQPVRLWQTAPQGRRAGVVADLVCGHEEADRAPIGIGNSV